jgi:hypothetical protein
VVLLSGAGLFVILGEANVEWWMVVLLIVVGLAIFVAAEFVK